MNPGTSLHFDGQALEEQQEAELKQEDLRREQELRELLSTALPDDLLDDDTASFSSHDSSGSLSVRDGHQAPPSPSPDPWVRLGKGLPGHHKLIQQHQQLQQTSTPNGFGNPPPLKTPAPISQQNGYREHQGNGQHYGHADTNGYHIQNGQQFAESSDEETLGQQYEEVVGQDAAGDGAPGQRQGPRPGHQYPGLGHIQDNGDPQSITSDAYAQHHGNNFHGDQVVINGYQIEDASHVYADGDPVPSENVDNGYEVAENGHFENQEVMYNREVQEYSPSHGHIQRYSPNRQQVTDTQHALQPGRTAQDQQAPYPMEARQSDPHSNGSNPAVHRVQYRGDGTVATNPHPVEVMPKRPHQSRDFRSVDDQATAGFAQQADGDQLQRQFLGVGGDEETRQMAQLQILYKARGRELDQQKNQLHVLQEESGREKRILNHQLALAQGEKEGTAASYDQCQRLLVEAQQDNSTLNGQLQAAQAQIQALNAAKHEVEAKLQSTESAIDSLTGQLTELHRSQPLARAREQQEGLLKSLQERYEQEVTRLKEKVDSGERLLEGKSDEVASLRQELSRVSREASQSKLEQGNTVNALTNQLQLSQKQCRDLLETGSLQEINLLRVQLQEAGTARSFSQDMASALQEELSEMKEQLQMYESAMELGAVPVTSPETVQRKSFAVRNLAKSDWRTPQSHGPSSDTPAKMTPDDLIQGLRKELERSLQSNRAKRAQVSKLQTDHRASKTVMDGLRKQLLESEATAKDKEVRFRVMEAQLEASKTSFPSEKANSTSASSGELQEKIVRLQTEKEDLSKMLEDLRPEEGRLNEMNADLKKQMAQMVSEWDQDKKIDLERVQKTCLQLHEDSSRHLRKELVTEFQSERAMLKEAHQHQLQELRTELERAQKELDDVKRLYVEVCEEKNVIEDTVTKTLTADAAKQLETAKEAWQAQHDAALQELRESLESSLRASLVMAKSSWRQEAEKEREMMVEDQVALAKEQWSEAVREEATKSARKFADAEWKVKFETELKQAEKDLEALHRDHLSKQREHLNADHERDQARAVKRALSTAKTAWSQTAEAEAKENMKKAIEMAREQWTQEDPDKRLEESVASARRQWIGQQVNWEKIKEEWLEEHGEEEIAKRVADETRALEAKHLADITGLQGVLEKGRQKIKREMEAEKLAAVQDAKTQLKKTHQEKLADALEAAKAGADNDKSQSLEVASREWQARLDKVMTERQDAINQALQEVHQQWQKEKRELLEIQKKALASLQAEATADQEELRSKYETELERGIQEAVRSAREQWSQNCDTELRKACDEILERKERVWQQEQANLQEQLGDTASQLRDQQRQSERHRKKHGLYRQKLEKEVASLREQLQDADQEMKQTEFHLRRELGQLQSRLKGANVAAVEALEAEMDRMRRRHDAELKAAKQRSRDRADLVDSDTQTVGSEDDGVTTGALQEIKAHYLRTIKKIKVDVMKRMGDMRENCRHTIHTEVLKERHSTAKKLRRYYLQSLQQFLDEDQTGSDRTKAQSTASKLAAMAKALELPPDQLMTGQSILPTTERSRENEGSPSLSVNSQGSNSWDRNRSSSPVGSQRPATDDRKRHQPRGFASQATSSQLRQDICYTADDKSIRSQSSLDCSGSEQVFLPLESSSASSSGNGNSSDQMEDLGTSSSSGTHWGEIETGMALSKLPIRPREFNPKPERLPSKTCGKPPATSAVKQSTLTAGNVTLRSRESSPDDSVSGTRRGNLAGISGRLHHQESLHERSLKSRENSPSCSPVDSGGKRQLQLKDGLTRMSNGRPSNDALNLGAREGSRETPRVASPGLRNLKTIDYPPTSKTTSNITSRSRRNEQPSSSDIGTSQQSPFMRPIAESKQSRESRRGPLRVPPPTEKTAAMLASLPSTISRPVSQITRHTQIPSPGPYRATDTSTASLDTVYNDLPASLGAISDYPLDNPPDFTLDKVVTFDHPAWSVSRKGKTHQENVRAKLSDVSSSGKVTGASSLPSRTSFMPKGLTLRSSDKLAYMLQQDSGFVSPQTEEV